MKISLWYHTILSNGHSPKDPRFSQKPIDPDWSVPLMLEQMETVKNCGLMDAADDFVVCVNGGLQNQIMARSCSPPKARFIHNGEHAKSLLATTRAMRQWTIEHPDWLVCFFHIKSVTHPHEPLDFAWRKCSEKWVLKNWRQCVADLKSGCDSVGTHWLTPEVFGPSIVPIPIWGGMFFWAKSSFLRELPDLPEAPSGTEDWWLPERWIGMGRRPKVKDYHPQWPGLQACSASAL